MISFTEFRNRQIVEADEAPATPEESPASTTLSAEIEQEIKTLFNNIKRVMYNRVVPNKAGTGFLSGLRNWWWKTWYGRPDKNPNHPMYSRGSWNKDQDLDYRRPNTGALSPSEQGAKKESVRPSLRVLAEWNRAIDDAEAELSLLSEEASSWGDIEKALDFMQADFTKHMKAILTKHKDSAADYKVSPAFQPTTTPKAGDPLAPPSKPVTPADPAALNPNKPAPLPSATGDLGLPTKNPAAPAPVAPVATSTPAGDPNQAAPPAEDDDAPPPHVVRTSELEPGAYPPGLRVDGRKGTLKNHTHDVLYKVYRTARDAEYAKNQDLSAAVPAGERALHAKLDELPLHKMKELGVAYGWHPPRFGFSSYGKDFMKSVLTFYIRRQIGEHPPVPRVLEKAGYKGDGFTPHTPVAKPAADPNAPIKPPATQTAKPSAPAVGQQPPADPNAAPVAPQTPAAQPPQTLPKPAAQPPAGDVHAQNFKQLEDAFRKVNWPELGKAALDGTVKAGIDSFIDLDQFKGYAEDFGPEDGQDNWVSDTLPDTSRASDERLARFTKRLQTNYGIKGDNQESIIRQLGLIARLYPLASHPKPDDSGSSTPPDEPPPGDTKPPAAPPQNPNNPAAPAASAAASDPQIEALKGSIEGYKHLDDEDQAAANKLLATAVKAGLTGEQANKAFVNYLINHQGQEGNDEDAILGNVDKVKELAGVASPQTPVAPPLPTDTPTTPEPEPEPEPTTPPVAPTTPEPEPEPVPAAPKAAAPAVSPEGSPAAVPPEDEKTNKPSAASGSAEENFEKVKKWRTDNKEDYENVMNFYQRRFPGNNHAGEMLLNTILTHFPGWSASNVVKVMEFVAQKAIDADDVEKWAQLKDAADGQGLGRAYAMAVEGKTADQLSKAKPQKIVTVPNGSFGDDDEDEIFGGKKKKSGKGGGRRKEMFDTVFGGGGVKDTDWQSEEKMPDEIFISSLDTVDQKEKFSGHYQHLLNNGLSKPEARKLVMNLLRGYISSGEYPRMETGQSDDEGGPGAGDDIDHDTGRRKGTKKKRLSDSVEYYREKLRNQSKTGYVEPLDRDEMRGMTISEKVEYLRSKLRNRV